MSFRDFTFPDVVGRLGLVMDNDRLFPDAPAVEPRPEFADAVREGAVLASGVNTEKARSEFLIAPLLVEVRRLLGRRHALFSGFELNVDPSRGLNGVCDFIISRDPRLYILSAPLVTVVEAKNDNVWNGFGQCIASMVAAWVFNEQAGKPLGSVYGVSTSGTQWKFLRLRGTALTIDLDDYYIDELGPLLGVLRHMIETG